MKKAVISFVLVLVMLMSVCPTFADETRAVSIMEFDGSCKKYFPTDESVTKTSSQNWYSFTINATTIQYQTSATYDDHFYACMIDTSGHVRSEVSCCYYGSNDPVDPLSSAQNYNTLKCKVMHHIYYTQNHASSSNKLTAVGSVFATKGL